MEEEEYRMIEFCSLKIMTAVTFSIIIYYRLGASERIMSFSLINILFYDSQSSKPRQTLLPRRGQNSKCYIGTCLIIAWENHQTPEYEQFHPVSPGINNSNAPCWHTEEHFIKESCLPCTKFEKVSKHLPACERTGLKEMVSCKQSGYVYRSCYKVTVYEARNFFLFQVCMGGIGTLGTFVVFWRRKELDKRMMARIQQQISSGV